MMRSKAALLGKIIVLISAGLLMQCADEKLEPIVPEEDKATTAAATTDCGCTYTVPSNTGLVDGAALGLKPGNVICLKAGNTYSNIIFRNIRGSAASPIIIKNCGGTVTLNATGKAYAMKTELSSYFRITGGSGSAYGIRLNAGSQGLQLEKLSTNFEVDHLEIFNSGFAGIMAKTEPSCDNATIRGNFVMRNISLHHNYVHDTGGEGFYVGNTFYVNGINTPCGVRLPHIIEGAKIYNNIVKNSGWESIQVGSTPKGLEVYNNRIENYGVKNVKYQNNGVQFGEGAPAKFYNNFIKGGKGIALFILGNADHFAYNNVIVKPGKDGIFCDERAAVGPGFRFINNTIINPGTNGITIYAEFVSMNTAYNNIVVNPGSYSTYTYPRTGNDAYIYLLGKTVKIQSLNNYVTRDINAVKFKNAAGDDYSVLSGSPAINKGYNISSFGILTDFRLQPRYKGSAYDIGAYEY